MTTPFLFLAGAGHAPGLSGSDVKRGAFFPFAGPMWKSRSEATSHPARNTGPVIAGCSRPPAPISLDAAARRPRYRWVQAPAGPAIAGCSHPPARISLGAVVRRPRYRWVQPPADPVIAGCSRPPARISLGARCPPAPISLGADARRPGYRRVQRVRRAAGGAITAVGLPPVSRAASRSTAARWPGTPGRRCRASTAGTPPPVAPGP